MGSKIVKALAELRDVGAEGPFGNATLQSNLIKAGVSRGLRTAADNLLAKALRAVVAGDEQRARGYVHRVVLLPVDEHEEVHPGSWAASTLLFGAVTDALEACEEDDPRWLDAADQVLRTTSDDGRHALLHTLRSIASDYELPHREARRINDMLGVRAEPSDGPLDEPADRTATVQAILAVISTVAAYHNALGPDQV